MGFNLYWPAGTHDQKDNHVFIAVKKDLLNKTVVKNRTNLISHLYVMVLDITEGEIYGKGKKRKTRIVNIYKNKLGQKANLAKLNATDKTSYRRFAMAVYYKRTSA